MRADDVYFFKFSFIFCKSKKKLFLTLRFESQNK